MTAGPTETPNWVPGDRVEVYLPDWGFPRRGSGFTHRWIGGTVRAVDLPGLPPGAKLDLDHEVNGVRDCYASHAELRRPA